MQKYMHLHFQFIPNVMYGYTSILYIWNNQARSYHIAYLYLSKQ